jgi:hypothetical protein
VEIVGHDLNRTDRQRLDMLSLQMHDSILTFLSLVSVFFILFCGEV